MNVSLIIDTERRCVRLKSPYICQLPQWQQDAIRRMLTEIKLDEEDIERAMDSRLFDLSETIDLEKVTGCKNCICDKR